MTAMRVFAALAAGFVALGGCSREAPPPVEANDVEAEPAAPAPQAPPPVAEAPPPPAMAETNVEEPAPEPVDESERTLDDADATGLTTRALPGVEDEDAPADTAAGGNSNE